MNWSEIVELAIALSKRNEFSEVNVNFQAARITVVVDPKYVEPKMKELINEAMKSYEKVGKIVELEESEIYIGAIEMVIEVDELRELEEVVIERGDFIQALSVTPSGMRVKVLLDSASVEKAVSEIVDYLSGLGVVEFVEAELETSKLAIFSPMSSTTPGLVILPPLRYKAYIDLCLRAGR